MIRSRLATAALSLALALGFAAPAAHADGWWNVKDATASVPVLFNFPAGTSLSLSVRNLSDNAVTDTVLFNYVPGAKYTVARQYVEMAVASNHSSWTVTTYTNNGLSTPSDSTGWGALVGADTRNKIPLLWTARDNYVSESAVPVINDTTVLSTGWVWYIDKGNYDYAQIAADTATFYTTALFGGASIDFNFGFGSGATSPLAFYVAAATNNVKPDYYATRLYYDLLHL